MERFSVGTVLGDGLRAFPRALARFLPLALICFAPVIWLFASVVAAPAGPPRIQAIDRASAWGWISLVLEVPVIGAIAHDVVHRLRGAPVPVFAAIWVGLRRSLAVLGTMLLVFLVVFALAFTMALPILGSASLGSGAMVVILSFAFLGLVLALYARWFVAVPAAVFERGGATALTRSGELTRDHRGALVAVLLVEGVLLVAAGIMVGVLASIRSQTWSTAGVYWYAGVQLGAIVLFSVLRATFSAVAYAQLVRAKYAGSPEELGHVFD